MNIQDQCCTLDQAKRIAGLGVNRSSLFKYLCYQCEPKFDPELIYSYEDRHSARSDEYIINAYNVSELGEMLHIAAQNFSKDELLFNFEDIGDIKLIRKFSDGSWERITSFYESTEAQARAEALIYLLDNKFLTAQQTNEAA